MFRKILDLGQTIADRLKSSTLKQKDKRNASDQSRTNQFINRFRSHWPLLIVVTLIIILLRPLFIQDGLPWGTDVHGHLARVWYVAKSIKEVGAFPSWFPYWYNGTTLLQYYPPLVTYVMLPVQLIFNDVTITYKVFVAVMLFLSGIFTYKLLFPRFGKAWAILAAMIYISAPYTIYAVFDEGNLPKVMAFAVTPIVLDFTLRHIKRGNKRTFLGLIITAGLLVLAHHQYAGMVFIIFGLISLMQLENNSESRVRIASIFVCFAFSLLLSSAWLIPALSHSDYPDVPNISLLPERIPLHSITWKFIDPSLRSENIGLVYLGLSLVILSAPTVFLVRSRRNIALFVAALICIALAFGVNNPAYRFLPLSDSFWPERFLHIATLLLAMLIANYGLITKNLNLRKGYQGILIVSLGIIILVDFSTYWRLPKVSNYPTVRSALNEIPAGPDSARLDVRSAEGSIWSLLPLIQGDMPLSFGWSIETTPHLQVYGQQNLAIRRGFPEFVPRNYYLWNVEAAVIANVEVSLTNTLNEFGYEALGNTGQSSILLTSNKASLVKELKSNSIVIGRGALNTSTVLPWMSYGISWNVDDYDQQYLQYYDLIYLYDFRFDNIFGLEKTIREWIQEGKTIVLDLTAMQDNNIFGVEANIIEVPQTPQFYLGTEADLEVDTVAEEPFVYQGNPWLGVSYSGLDGEILNVVDDSGNQAPVLGYKELPEGRVYYLGLNWISHVMDSRDQAAITFITDFFQRADPNQLIKFPDLPVNLSNQPSDSWGFTYETNRDLGALISVTWSPHWSVSIDDVPTEIYNHENLIFMYLPAGSHQVEFEYVSTPIQWLGLGVSAVSVVVLFVVILNYSSIIKNLERISIV